MTTETNDPKKAARDEAMKDVKLYLANDWNLKEETPEYFLLTKSTATVFKQFLLLIFIGWWTLFIPNIIYYFTGKKTKKIIK